MKETEYDRIMKLGEKGYLRLKKENDPYAFYKAVEMVNRESGCDAPTAGGRTVNPPIHQEGSTPSTTTKGK